MAESAFFPLVSKSLATASGISSVCKAQGIMFCSMKMPLR
jgi:hypothetical protein